MKDADKLKHFRIKRGISQQALADEMGIAQTLISMIEKGAREASSGFKLAFLKTYGIEWDSQMTPSGTLPFINNTKKRRYVDYSHAIAKIGKKILAIQTSNNLDNAEMAKILDMSERRYEKIVIGKEKPYFDEIVSLAENFDVSLDEVILDIQRDSIQKNQTPSPGISEKELELLKTFKTLKSKGLI